MNIYSINVKPGVTLYKIKTEAPHDVLKRIHCCSDFRECEVVFFQYSQKDECLSLALSGKTDVIPLSETKENLCAVTVSGTGLEEEQAVGRIVSALDCADSLCGVSMSEVELTLLLPESYARGAGDLILRSLGLDI